MKNDKAIAKLKRRLTTAACEHAEFTATSPEDKETIATRSGMVWAYTVALGYLGVSSEDIMQCIKRGEDDASFLPAVRQAQQPIQSILAGAPAA